MAAAQAAVAAAQASLNKVLEGAAPGALDRAATDEVANAKAALDVAQAAYDKVAGNPDVGASPQALAAPAGNQRLQRSRCPAVGPGTRGQQGGRGCGAGPCGAGAGPAPVGAGERAAGRRGRRRGAGEVGAKSSWRWPRLAPGARQLRRPRPTSRRPRLRSTRRRLRCGDTEVKAPFAGTLAALSVRQGEQLAPGAPVRPTGEPRPGGRSRPPT